MSSHVVRGGTVVILTGKSNIFPLGKRNIWQPKAAQDL